MSISRRNFLRYLSSIGLSSSFLGYLPKSLIAQMEVRKSKFPLLENWIPSVCGQCPGGCGILVRVIRGQAVKIEGNPLHPVNQGTLCPKGHSGLHVLYDPDRIKFPLRRTGKRGEGRWERISWEEAIELTSEELRGLRKEGEAHSLMVISGQKRGISYEVLKRFTRSFGSPNFGLDSSDYSQTSLSSLLMQGIEGKPCYDLSKVNYILSFNSSFLDVSWSPVQSMRAYSRMRERRLLERSKLVHIGPYLSVTAAKADEWIPIIPETEAALALSICYVIIQDGLLNENFISEHTFGFHDWKDQEGKVHIGFKTLVLNNYSPGEVSELINIPTQTIVRLAREFSLIKPSLAIDEGGVSTESQNTYSRMAIHSLNALIGNIETPGGVLTPRKISSIDLPDLHPSSSSEKSLRKQSLMQDEQYYSENTSELTARLPEKIIKNDPYTVKVLLLYNSNPLFSSINSSYFLDAFLKIPFIISFSPFMNESTFYSDLVLPDCTYLEKWEDDPIYTLEGYPILSIRQPVVEPVYDTKNTTDVILQISKKVIEDVPSPLPWKDAQELLQYRLRNLFRTASGDVFGKDYETMWIRLLESVGWRSVSYTSFEDFSKEVFKKGGWWDPIYHYGEWDRVFKTSSKKFEFFSQKLSNLPKLKDLRKSVKGDLAYLPHYEPSNLNGDEMNYPFYLNVYPLLAFYGGGDTNQPWLKDISGLKVQKKWDCWVEINPEKALDLKISEGDWVWVESEFGKLKLRAKLFPGTMPEVVNVPFGFGHSLGGRWSMDKAGKLGLVVQKRFDRIGGHDLWNYTRVRIYKA